jgi:hypothetical protein
MICRPGRAGGPSEGEHLSRKKSALDTLSETEKGQLLDELLTARPDLRELAESCAAQRMSAEDSSVVAKDVEQALRGLDIEELNSPAGYVRGVGYVHPAEAADEILDEALQPFLDDLARRAELGMIPAAGELAVGILRGLYGCRDGAPESLLEYSPDYAPERASHLIDQCEKLGVDLAVTELLDLMPTWSTTLTRNART